LVKILNRQEFDRYLHSALQNPSSVPQSILSLLYLVLANGLVVALPETISEAVGGIITDTKDHAELLFRRGKRLAEGSREHNDGDIRYIQAEVLMALYSFLVSKWSSAYIILGKFPCKEAMRQRRRDCG
jgi:hypothetical protein